MSYCLGTCSCFVVVFSVAFLVTILSNVPLVFLRLAETEAGEVDLRLETGGDIPDANSLDYTKISEAAATLGGGFSYHAPRLRFNDDLVHVVNPTRCSDMAAEDIRTSKRDKPFDWVFRPPQRISNQVSDCHFSISECMQFHCGKWDHADLWVIDSVREKRMGYGRNWQHAVIPDEHVVISQSLATVSGLGVGDTMLLTVALSPSLLGIFKAQNLSKPDWPFTDLKTASIPVTVFDVIDDAAGKLPSADDYFLFMEMETFLPYAVKFLHPDIPDVTRERLAKTDVRKYVQEVGVNMAPDDRYHAYLVNNYDKVQQRVVSWSANLIYKVGFNQISTEAGILEYMRDVRFFSLFLGLLISLVVVVLMSLAIILIYSLLMINVETRTFELGVLRMMGMKKWDLVQLVMTQAFMYALPAWVGGMIFSLIVWNIVRAVLEKAILVDLPIGLDGLACGLASLIGLLMPLVASIAPIRHCLGLALQDALDTSHSKTKAVSFSYERSEGSSLSVPTLILGLCMSAFGFCLYYLFPLALLSFNIALLFYIFFGILMGLLFGLILLTLNFEHLVEKGLTHLIFFWENYAVRTLILKNLVAHRIRNRKTTLMYALSLGFIIWINVSWELQVESVAVAKRQLLGSHVVIESDEYGMSWKMVNKLDKILQTLHPDVVSSWGYVTLPLDETLGVAETHITSLGRYQEFKTEIVGVSPNLFGEATNTEFLKAELSNASHGAAVSEQLYTRWAYDEAIVGTLYYDATGRKDLGGDKPSMSLAIKTHDMNKNREIQHHVPIRTAAAMDSVPILKMSQFPARRKQHIAVSIPTYISLSYGWMKSMRDVRYETIVITLKNGEDPHDMNVVKSTLLENLSPEVNPQDISILDLESETEAIRDASKILKIFFIGITIITMSMCFFSLTASMYTNIQLQSKEVGVLRALGLTIPATKRLYIWEAFVLVLTASFMGFFVGTAVAYTMVLQRALFLQLPLKFIFPVELFFLVVTLAFLFSIIASYGPATNLLRRSIVAILRKTH